MTVTLDSLLAGARDPIEIVKAQLTSEGAGTFQSLWLSTGNPAAGVAPPAFSVGSGYVPTRATLGALGQVDAANGSESRVTGLSATSSTAGRLFIYDRLWACSGFGTVVTTAQNVVTGGALPTGRLKNGVDDYSDCELWGEVYTAPGATTATWTATAPDGGNTSRAFTYTHPANAETVGQMFQFVRPAASAAGCRVPTVFQCSASSGTAGSIGLTVLRKIAVIDLALINVGAFRSAIDLGLKRIRDDACLAMMVQCTTTNTGALSASLGYSSVVP